MHNSTRPPEPQSSNFKHWLGLFVLWTLPSLQAPVTLWIVTGPTSLPEFFVRPDFWSAFLPNLLSWYLWVPLTFWVLRLGRRFPLLVDGALRWRFLALHVVFSFLFNLFFQAWQWTLVFFFNPFPDMLAFWSALRLGSRVHGALFNLSFTYWLVLLAAMVWRHYWQSREQERQLTEARLTALKAQIHPHFLFNTLNSVSTLMEDDVDGARRTIARLSQLLRASLTEPPGELVSLKDEMDLVRLYLGIEQVRFADRLEVSYEIADSSQQLAVPHLLLQPLVENAIRHGIGKRSDAGRVRIASILEGEVLVLEIEDDGPGPATTTTPGIGLANSRARLDHLYGSAASLELLDRAPGCLCRVRMPARPAPEKE